MARHKSSDSVSTKVSNLAVDEFVVFIKNPYSSVAVMVSNLKRKEEHKNKIFKIKQQDGIVEVLRVK